jgi:hypothetical protein
LDTLGCGVFLLKITYKSCSLQKDTGAQVE